MQTHLRRTRESILILTTFFCGLGTPAAALAASPDSLYNANHPRLLFQASELTALRARVTDGGFDDDIFQAVQDLASSVYPSYPSLNTPGPGYGLETIPNLGLAAYFSSAVDTTLIELGRTLTLMIAQQYDVDLNEADSGLRLRSLALGYDMFFAGASEAEREIVRNEIESYLSTMTWQLGYKVFEYRPYLGNHSAMFAAAMGLAAICMWEELDYSIVSLALARADQICENIFTFLVDEKGSYGEGVFYALWTMKHLTCYFEARRRFDQFDYSLQPRVRAMEEWLAYEVLPAGGGRSLNLNDSSEHASPFALQPAYFAWATSRWSSGLSAWLWDHAAGTFGVPGSDNSGRAGSILWLEPIAPVHPGGVLPRRRLFPGRGLYHFRTGWQSGARSDDVVFAFFSGEFQGGHAQEDQNQFVLHAYGARFAVDHGPGSTAAESQAHNMVFIDGAGQHNAGSSIGTDGRIREHLLTGFADYVMGDATAAYTTHSPFNNPDVPVFGIDWSWGYAGSNPVEYAHRRIVAVDDGTSLPYFVVMDDIRKDDAIHNYEWRMHTSAANAVSVLGNPITISADSASMALHLLGPDPVSVTAAVSPFDNNTPEADSKIIRVSYDSVEARFAFLLLPVPAGTADPVVSTTSLPWGFATTIDFGDGTVDTFLKNEGGGQVTHAAISTDAELALVRRSDGVVARVLATKATTLSIDGILYAEILDAPAGFALGGEAAWVDRYDADFRFLDTGATLLHYRDQVLGMVSDGNGYLVADATTSVVLPAQPPSPLFLSTHPNPFNPATTIRVTAPPGESVAVAVYDVAGRLVRELWRGRLASGERTLTWDGSGSSGAPAASGMYFVVATSASDRFVAKVTLLK